MYYVTVLWRRMIYTLISSSSTISSKAPMGVYKTCSSPTQDVSSRYLVWSENSLLIVEIGIILNKELEVIFRSDRSDPTCVYS